VSGVCGGAGRVKLSEAQSPASDKLALRCGLAEWSGAAALLGFDIDERIRICRLMHVELHVCTQLTIQAMIHVLHSHEDFLGCIFRIPKSYRATPDTLN
jgi:hypothetical protein